MSSPVTPEGPDVHSSERISALAAETWLAKPEPKGVPYSWQQGFVAGYKAAQADSVSLSVLRAHAYRQGDRFGWCDCQGWPIGPPDVDDSYDAWLLHLSEVSHA